MSAIVRYDIEWALPPVVVAYLKGKLSADMQAVSPVITIFDPMAIEELNRFIVEVPKATTMPEAPANFSGTCECTVKSRWSKPTAKADLEAHFDRTNWLRDALMSASLADDLNVLAVGFAIDFVQPKRDFNTDVREGWVYSPAVFTFNGFFKATTDPVA